MVSDVVEVALGPETYSPVEDESFTVGPLSYRTSVRRGESAEQALDRALRCLEGAQERFYLRALALHLRRLEDASEAPLRGGKRAP